MRTMTTKEKTITDLEIKKAIEKFVNDGREVLSQMQVAAQKLCDSDRFVIDVVAEARELLAHTQAVEALKKARDGSK